MQALWTKRWRNRVLAVAGVAALGLGAALAQAPLKITLAGGSVGGAWSTMGTAIGETIRLQAPGSAFTYEPGVDAANVVVLRGDPAASLVQHAEHVGASAIVIGTRGRGGIKRAVLGSVSDHVIRHAPCPVIVTTHHGAEHEPG